MAFSYLGAQCRETIALPHSRANEAYCERLRAEVLGHKTVAMVITHYGRWIGEGEALGFDRPPRTYGMKRLWAQEKTG